MTSKRNISAFIKPAVVLAGFPVHDYTLTGLFAPAATPVAIIARLNRDTIAVINAAETREKLLRSGIEVATSTPAGLAELIRNDMAHSGSIIRAAGIRTD